MVDTARATRAVNIANEVIGIFTSHESGRIIWEHYGHSEQEVIYKKIREKLEEAFNDCKRDPITPEVEVVLKFPDSIWAAKCYLLDKKTGILKPVRIEEA